jgi:hypothetical protein
MPVSEIRPRARHALLLAAGVALLTLPACVPLPVRVTPPVNGRVQDARTGKPVAGAVVVVRFDARYDDLLPDRDVIGHREVISAADGSFAFGRSAEAGLAVWPYTHHEARVIGVIADGYRCATPRVVPSEGELRIDLAPAQDDDDRRATCHPLGARAAEAPLFLAAWQALHPRDDTRGQAEQERDIERLLIARSVFGFGENCRGPVVDLVLSPDGRFVAWQLDAAAGGGVEVVATTDAKAQPVRLALPADRSGNRLAWTARGELVLWEPASELERSLSPSALSSSGPAPEVLWRAGRTVPASASRDARQQQQLPLEPSDLRDEGDARWLGRAFRVTRLLDVETGLGQESLRIRNAGHELRSIALPGEACGPRGEFGAPQLRIGADTRTAFDLRHTGDGCGVVAIDLETAAWRRLDRAGAGVCSTSRQVPITHLQTAMRGYVTEVEEKLVAVGSDPMAAFSLRLGANGSAEAFSRTYAGELVRAQVPRFPVRTPLRRIDVGVVGSASGGTGEAPVPRMEPL